jgi:diguanylate cyclase (GGDEF)-like protein
MHDSVITTGSVLIVDDETTILEILHETLSLEGYRCDKAASGDVAIAMLKTRPFDIMITDIVMPGLGGLELTEQAKKLNPAMPVIVMTGFIDEFTYDKAIASGASDFIKKPFTAVELLMRIKHVRQQEKLRVMAITDELTGLLNRRGFFNLAEQQLRIARRRRKWVYMVYVDIDNMKEINNRLGHQEGDVTLTDTAHLLRATFRDSDIIARIGGDEFVVITVESDENSLEHITDRLQKNVDDHNRSNKREHALSLSFGISRYTPESSGSLDILLTQADKLMLEQKVLKHKS